MLPKKPPKRLFKNRDVIHAYEHDRSAKNLLKRMPRDHPDVLHAIESAIVAAARQAFELDDFAISRTLRSFIRGTELPDDAGSGERVLAAHLTRARAAREDVSRDIWIAGLRTVDDSVRRHSALLPDEVSYLEFVKHYVF
jgi:hypothetical protein